MSLLSQFHGQTVAHAPVRLVKSIKSVDAPLEYATVYELRAQIVVRFTATNRTYQPALHEAHRSILEFVYEEPLKLINTAIEQIYAGDEQEVVRLLLQIREVMTNATKG